VSVGGSLQTAFFIFKTHRRIDNMAGLFAHLLEKTTWAVVVRLTTPLLGTVPKSKDVYTKFILSKMQAEEKKRLKERQKELTNRVDEEQVLDKTELDSQLLLAGQASEDLVKQVMAEEQSTVEEAEEKGWTGFHRDENGYFVYDYFIKGFINHAARTLKEDRVGAVDVKQLQDKCKRYVFVTPRRIYLPVPKDENILPILERPLRAETPQGPRVALTRSDMIKEGAEIEFKIQMLSQGNPLKVETIQKILGYGEFFGLGQWRSGGYGRFETISFELVNEESTKKKRVKKTKEKTESSEASTEGSSENTDTGDPVSDGSEEASEE